MEQKSERSNFFKGPFLEYFFTTGLRWYPLKETHSWGCIWMRCKVILEFIRKVFMPKRDM